MTFQLTAWEPPPARPHPYEVRTGAEGAPWRPVSPANVRGYLEHYTVYPDDDRARLEAGEVIRLPKATTPIYLRRRDAVPDRRQLALL